MASKQSRVDKGSHLLCPRCNEVYKKPRYLPCYHTYCEECLVNLQRDSTITCSKCNKSATVPAGKGAKSFPNNFFFQRIVDELELNGKLKSGESIECNLCRKKQQALSWCNDCSAALCNDCCKFHKSAVQFDKHDLKTFKDIKSNNTHIKITRTVKCDEPGHHKELDFYCEGAKSDHEVAKSDVTKCGHLVCLHCITTEHIGHDYNTVVKMAKKHREEVDKEMEPVEKMIKDVSKHHKQVMSTKEKIEKQMIEVDKEIDAFYNELLRRLEKQREELKKELHEVSELKTKALSLQLEQMENTQVQLESLRELNDAVKSGADQESLFMKNQVIEDVERLTDCYDKLKTEPVELASTQFVPVKEYEVSYPQFGHVLYDLQPENIEADVPEWTLVEKEVKFKFVGMDRKNRCSKEGRQVAVEARSSRGEVIPSTIQDNNDGSYSASLVANETGEVNVSINIKGKHIKGSPYNILVRKYSALNNPGEVVNDGGRMGKPSGIAFGKDGVWAVADGTNHCVRIFDKQDQLVRKCGSKGIGSGQFDYPNGLAFDANNHLYVVDYGNHRVQKFNISGEYLLCFGNNGSGDGELQYPLGITVHNNRVFVADQVNQRISVFQCGGQYSHTIGRSGQLNHPFDVAVNDNNQVLVANHYGNCISIFTLDGNYVNNVATEGSGRGQLSGPTSLTIDMYGFILVTDHGNSRVSIFDKDGTFIHCFGSKGSANGEFSFPSGIALSPNGTVYVCDRENNRIQIFSNY